MTLAALWIYVAGCLFAAGFQVALIAGAPWGHLTQGGQGRGPLPRPGRVIAALSVPILATLALAMMSAAGLWPGWPAWTGWAALGVQAVITLLNWITPSRPERRLWAPIETALLGAALVIML